jgi:hypothetical protein
MVQWEYQVIRLNVEPPVAAAPPVEPPAPAPAPSPSQAPAPPAAKPGFSEAYLREEFPRYYDNPPAQAQPQSEDPGAQLQTFLNGHGQQGWELVGFQHAAPHVFIVFKRTAGGSDSAQAALAAQQEQLRLTLDLANRALAIIEKQAG